MTGRSIHHFVTSRSYLAVPLVLFLLLLLAVALRSPRLFSEEGLTGAVVVSAPLILATLGLTPIVMAGRGAVDLSVGPLLGFVNVTLIAWLAASAVTHPVLFFGWAIGLACAWQLLQALVVIYVRVAPIIVSLSGYLVLSGVNLLVMSRPGGLAPDWMLSWGGGSATGLLPPVLWIVLAALVFWAIVRRTGFFTQLQLMGCDERMAFSSGIRTDLVRVLAYLLGGVFMGLAGICHTALISSGDPTQGANYTLQAVTALVLGGASLAGGRGSATGAVLGAVNMFLITYILGTFDFGSLSGFVTKLSFGSILVASLLINLLIIGRRAKGGA